MKIMLVGGGSGGHLTPLLAVAHELKKLQPDMELIYIAHRGDNLSSVVKDHATISRTHSIFAGKLRRYHGAGWRQLFDIVTLLKNLRDLLYLLLGLLQSIFILRRERPKVLFIKGGFVGVPVGLAARFWKIPYITHDSDALPGLANRILAKKARLHAVALPKELYSYPADKTVEVGVPVSPAYAHVTEADMRTVRQKLELPANAKVLFITGGGLGAQRMNDVLLQIAPSLFEAIPDLFVLHQAGQKNEQAVRATYEQILPRELQERVWVYGFTTQMADLSAAADVVVSRAGATNMAEFALQSKPVIVVPNPMLTGGHQLKNAVAFEERKAAVVVQETNLQTVESEIVNLMQDATLRKTLAQNLHSFAKPHAAEETAALILKTAHEE